MKIITQGQKRQVRPFNLCQPSGSLRSEEERESTDGLSLSTGPGSAVDFLAAKRVFGALPLDWILILLFPHVFNFGLVLQ